MRVPDSRHGVCNPGSLNFADNTPSLHISRLCRARPPADVADACHFNCTTTCNDSILRIWDFFAAVQRPIIEKKTLRVCQRVTRNFCFILYAMSLGNRCDSSTAMLDLDLTTLFTSKPVRLQLRMQNGYQFLAVHAGFLWRWLEAQNRRGHIQQTQAGMHCVCYFYRKTL